MEILLFGFWLLCGFVAASIYKNKGRSPGVAFIVGLLFGPIGVLLALLTSADTKGVQQRALQSGEMRKCLHCAELVKSDARVCRYCQRELTVQA